MAEIFCKNLPPQCSQKRLHDVFAPHLARFGVRPYEFVAEKIPNKSIGFISVLDPRAAKAFLAEHGVPANSQNAKPRIAIKWARKTIFCSENTQTPDPFTLLSLKHQAEQQRALQTQQAHKEKAPTHKTTRNYDVQMLDCGMWDFQNSSLAFFSYYTSHRPGRLLFGDGKAIILLSDTGGRRIRIDLEIHNCAAITLNSRPSCITFSMFSAPKVYSDLDPNDPQLNSLLAALNINDETKKEMQASKSRLIGIDPWHAKVAGVCFNYRITVENSERTKLLHFLQGAKKMPSMIRFDTPVFQEGPHKLEEGFTRLNYELSDMQRFGSLTWALRYQVEKLARNAILRADQVCSLLPSIKRLYFEKGLESALQALRLFHKQCPPPSPETNAFERSTEYLVELLQSCAESFDTHPASNPYAMARRYTHIALVHRVVVTPCGLYYEGPYPEPTNRVLRRYSDHPDHFIRVLFQDEDGSAVRHDPLASQHAIYHERFKKVLEGNILLCGRSYQFLGFSHSSLRSQSCWYLSPLIMDGSFKFAPQILKELGDFSHIRSPAKAAARIGQCFTDTVASVELKPPQVGELPMIQRPDEKGVMRDFADGCGTISLELLRNVYHIYGSRRDLKPTVLQIRFGGAKGVVSLDARLKSKKLLLRNNMVKFPAGPGFNNLEICGAAFRPLPLVLNRQFIKLLEDLGVDVSVFMNLQDAAMDRLASRTHSGLNAASLIADLEVPKSTRLDLLLEKLDEIGFDYRRDRFLHSVVEIAVLTQLREMKYRGRIPVPQALLLYGIADETGVLQEGEIFISTEQGPQGGQRRHIQQRVIVSKSPALHPGDLQLVRAVDVPESSPLRRLSNVVVFSQHGQRDLASMLSGGDLDGDLFAVILDPRLIPDKTVAPADYLTAKAVELDREVTREDMASFFVRFMESDVLGMLSNLHQQLADQRPQGTSDPDCLRLAEMASTAVDYSKTGIAVDLKKLPKRSKHKPDFMAPSPRVVLSDLGDIDLEQDDNDEDIEDAILDLDQGRRKTLYYPSQKALGQLFRAIDERKFLGKMQVERVRHADAAPLGPILLSYARKFAKDHGILFEHWLPLGDAIKWDYELAVQDILWDCSPVSGHAVTEHELFAGTILGRHGGAQGKPLRELSKSLRDRFNVVVEYAAMQIKWGEEGMATDDLDALYGVENLERDGEAFPRAIASLQIAVETPGLQDARLGRLSSFKYVAAAVLLAEMDRWRKTTLNRYGPLPRLSG